MSRAGHPSTEPPPPSAESGARQPGHGSTSPPTRSTSPPTAWEGDAEPPVAPTESHPLGPSPATPRVADEGAAAAPAESSDSAPPSLRPSALPAPPPEPQRPADEPTIHRTLLSQDGARGAETPELEEAARVRQGGERSIHTTQRSKNEAAASVRVVRDEARIHLLEDQLDALEARLRLAEKSLARLRTWVTGLCVVTAALFLIALLV